MAFNLQFNSNMTEYSLSICMPSKRNLEESRASIASAIGFCDSTGSELVISDNSGTPNKSEMWNKIPLPFMKYLNNEKNQNLIWSDNLYNGIKNCAGNFIGILSDDDILVNIDKSVLDYQNINFDDVIGIKPLISLWNSEAGVYKQNNFNIDANSATERIKQYFSLAKGNNTTYFSFYRSKILNDIFKLLKNHPTKGGYIDWSIVLACVASGKILVDPSKQLIYKNSNWFGDQNHINNQIKKLYLDCGLGENGTIVSSIFDALDAFILIMRKNSNILIDEKIEAAEFALNSKIQRFLIDNDATKLNEIFPISTIKKINDLKIENKIDEKLDTCLQIIVSLYPSLGEKYKEFYKFSTELTWGNIF